MEECVRFLNECFLKLNQKDISILIPTLGRPEILLRQINFYIKLKAEFVINICDSTKKPRKSFLKKIDQLSNSIDINYFHEPELNDRQAILFLINKSITKYSAFIADDDFFIPRGLKECAEFLDNNSDFRVAYGHSIQVDMASISKNKNQLKASHYSGLDISFDNDNPQNRLDLLSKSYAVSLFGLHRTEELLSDYLVSGNISSQAMGEMLVNYLTIARGKSKSLKNPYLIRLNHSGRYLPPNRFVDLMVEDNFGECIPIFVNEIRNSLLKNKIKENKANELAKNYIKVILLNSIQKKFINKEYFIINIFKNILSKLKLVKLSINNRIFMNSNYFIRFKYYLDLIRYS